MEADIIGMDLAARACFDPAAGKHVFQRLGELEKKMGADKMPSLLRTHPVRCCGSQGQVAASLDRGIRVMCMSRDRVSMASIHCPASYTQPHMRGAC